MKTYLVIYKDYYLSYDIQTVEGYWDLRYKEEPTTIIELTGEMIIDIRNLENKGE